MLLDLPMDDFKNSVGGVGVRIVPNGALTPSLSPFRQSKTKRISSRSSRSGSSSASCKENFAVKENQESPHSSKTLAPGSYLEGGKRQDSSEAGTSGFEVTKKRRNSLSLPSTSQALAPFHVTFFSSASKKNGNHIENCFPVPTRPPTKDYFNIGQSSRHKTTRRRQRPLQQEAVRVVDEKINVGGKHDDENHPSNKDFVLRIPENLELNASSLTDDYNRYEGGRTQEILAAAGLDCSSTKDRLLNHVGCNGLSVFGNKSKRGSRGENKNGGIDDTTEPMKTIEGSTQKAKTETMPELIEETLKPLFSVLFGGDSDSNERSGYMNSSGKHPVNNRGEENRLAFVVESKTVKTPEGFADTPDFWMDDEDYNVELRCQKLNKNDVICYDLGMHLEENIQGMARVKLVLKDSAAEESGVRIGDVISFAVALNSVNFNGKGDMKVGVDLAFRLDALGMRMSYRELFNLFLSKTTAGWPIALVLHHRSEANDANRQQATNLRLPLVSSGDFATDCLVGAECLHELNVKSHELPNCANEIIWGNMEKFMSRPKSMNACDVANTSGFGAVVTAAAKSFPHTQKFQEKSICVPVTCEPPSLCFENPRKFRSYVEDSVGMAFFQIRRAVAGIGFHWGSGFLLSRINNEKWSAPCSVGLLGVGIGIQGAFEVVDLVMLIQSNEFMDNLRNGQGFKLGGCGAGLSSSGMGFGMEFCGFSSYHDEVQRQPFVAYAKNHGIDIGMSLVGSILYHRHGENKKMYPDEEDVSPRTILSEVVDPPNEASEIYGALRSLQFPYKMFAHPIPPDSLKQYISDDWWLESSCESSCIKGFYTMKSVRLREMLTVMKSSVGRFERDLQELFMFEAKFQRFLKECVPVELLLIDGKTLRPHKVMLRLTTPQNQSLECAEISLLDTKENIDYGSLKLDEIVHITKHFPSKLSAISQFSRDKLARLICLRSSTDTAHAFITKSVKDADLILCGLKLVLESLHRDNVNLDG